jgi:hypothetical protein
MLNNLFNIQGMFFLAERNLFLYAFDKDLTFELTFLRNFYLYLRSEY